MHILKHSFCFLSFFGSPPFYFDYEFQELSINFAALKGILHGFHLNGKLWMESKSILAFIKFYLSLVAKNET